MAPVTALRSDPRTPLTRPRGEGVASRGCGNCCQTLATRAFEALVPAYCAWGVVRGDYNVPVRWDDEALVSRAREFFRRALFEGAVLKPRSARLPPTRDHLARLLALGPADGYARRRSNGGRAG